MRAMAGARARMNVVVLLSASRSAASTCDGWLRTLACLDLTHPCAFVLILFNKPYGVLTQFTDAQGRATLADYIPLPNIYPAGRLDRDSEGLLLLTDDGKLQQRLSDPRFKEPKVYWAQVEGEPTDAALERLRRGIELDSVLTAPAQARRMSEPELWPRIPPIRVRRAIPTSWIEIVLTEGRNRQARRMTAAVGHPTLRLVRYAVGRHTIAGLGNGKWRHA